MTRFLASVRNGQEAEAVLAAGADIVDLKSPEDGALGAVDLETVAAVVTAVGGAVPVSATVGDLPMPARSLRARIDGLVSAQVDYVKIGFDGELPGGLEADADFIAVIFADRAWALDLVARARDYGFSGVMLDTAAKQAGSLLDHCDESALGRFLDKARCEGLLAGLAGSLRERHLPGLLSLQPDVLGFRGALCHTEARIDAIDPAACRRIRALISVGLEPSALTESYSYAMRASADC
jgi:(5-formylfuran-3-yl)methyl phosphate synthase